MASTPENPHIAASLLSRAHSPTTAASIFRDRVKQKPLLLRPSSPDPASNARTRRRTARQAKTASQSQRKSHKPKPLSAKQKRALCIHEIPQSQRRYAVYEPLHALWCGYVREILGLEGRAVAFVTPPGAGPLLAAADYHGALVEVVRSRCVSRVGLKGVVIKDSKFTFQVITKANVLKTVPKEHSIFRFEVPHEVRQGEVDGERKALVFELHGSQFENRPADRATKKVRPHHDPDL